MSNVGSEYVYYRGVVFLAVIHDALQRVNAYKPLGQLVRPQELDRLNVSVGYLPLAR